ncbi:MAG: hypothetical protein AAFR66_00475, partial [Bacteroidota bacterium]
DTFIRKFTPLPGVDKQQEQDPYILRLNNGSLGGKALNGASYYGISTIYDPEKDTRMKGRRKKILRRRMKKNFHDAVSDGINPTGSALGFYRGYPAGNGFPILEANRDLVTSDPRVHHVNYFQSVEVLQKVAFWLTGLKLQNDENGSIVA